VPAGHGVAGPQPVDGALEDHLATGRTGAGAEVDDVVGDRDRLRLVLDDQHGVALVPQLQQQVVHSLDVVRMQADRRLVEHVRDVGQRGPHLPDHLRPLRLTAGQRAGRPVEREVTEPDLDERVERLPERDQQRRHRRLVQPAHPPGRSLISIAQASAMLTPSIFEDRACLPQPGAVAVRAGVNVTARSTNARMCGCIASTSLDSIDFWMRGIQTLVREVDALDLDLGRLLVEQVVELPLGELLDRLVRVEEAAAG
jgi:hypothetical protein